MQYWILKDILSIPELYDTLKFKICHLKDTISLNLNGIKMMIII